MEPEGAKRIWERSFRNNKLRYAEFYEDGVFGSKRDI